MIDGRDDQDFVVDVYGFDVIRYDTVQYDLKVAGGR
jgi:hypothetical protein